MYGYHNDTVSLDNLLPITKFNVETITIVKNSTDEAHPQNTGAFSMFFLRGFLAIYWSIYARTNITTYKDNIKISKVPVYP